MFTNWFVQLYPTELSIFAFDCAYISQHTTEELMFLNRHDYSLANMCLRYQRRRATSLKFIKLIKNEILLDYLEIYSCQCTEIKRLIAEIISVTIFIVNQKIENNARNGHANCP